MSLNLKYPASSDSQLIYGRLLCRLPKLREDLRKQQIRNKKEIHELPAPLSREPMLEMRLLITKFTVELRDSIQGLFGNEELMQKCNGFYEQFRKDIRGTAPLFQPNNEGDGICSYSICHRGHNSNNNFTCSQNVTLRAGKHKYSDHWIYAEKCL